MKNFITIFVLLISLVGTAQNNNAPSAIKTAFTKAFDNVSDVKWEKEGKSYEVSFVQNANKMSALIDMKGNILETETELKISSLSLQIINYIKDHYKGKALIGAAKIINAAGILNYEAAIKGKDILFDANGTFLKEVKE